MDIPSYMTIEAYDKALDYLNRKMYSRGELEDRLRRKGFREEDVKKTLDQLEDEGLVDDRQYAKTYLRNLTEYKTFGYYGIRLKLLKKKLNKNLIDELLKSKVTQDVEREIAKRFLEKTINKGRSKTSLMQALNRKGFRTPVIFDVLDD